MITYTKDKIIADNQEWITKSVNIDELLWAVKGKSWLMARMMITSLLIKKLEIDPKQAFTVASSMKDDFETFYSLN